MPMRIRDSGMPEEATWQGFFDPETTLGTLGLDRSCADVVEFGCGYGTFTIPAARIVAGTVFALDMDPAMLAATGARADEHGLENVRLIERDFMAEGTGLPDGVAEYAMVFNILHPEEPLDLLREARRTLCPAGLLGIIHWNHDPTTPRGPDMSFRPRPEQCLSWAEAAGFERAGDGIIELTPYHYGVVMRKT